MTFTANPGERSVFPAAGTIMTHQADEAGVVLEQEFLVDRKN